MTLHGTSLASSALLVAPLAPNLSQAQPVAAGEVVERALALHRQRAVGITLGAGSLDLRVGRRRSIAVR